jgi:hypothetical protein
MLSRTLLLLFSAGVMVASATKFQFVFLPDLSAYPIIGQATEFEIFQVELTLPTIGDPDYILSVETNYPAPIQPGTPAVIPPVLFMGGYYSMSDFLITWNGGYYGVVLGAHDDYVAGDLYQAAGFQTSYQVLGLLNSSLRDDPVLLDSGGSPAGYGSVGVSVTGDGVTTGMYTIVDKFTAPPGFLMNGEFDIIMSSFVCANGLIIGSDDAVPEPGTLFECIPALLLIGYGLARRAGRTSRKTPRLFSL